MEARHPKRLWRDAFEDLLALEANGEMITLESRIWEQAMGLNISKAKISFHLNNFNGATETLVRRWKRLHTVRERILPTGDSCVLSQVDYDISETNSAMHRSVKLANQAKSLLESHNDWPASHHKHRGQWIASLITSGALLPEWSSKIEGYMLQQRRVSMLQDTDSATDSSEKRVISFTEEELRRRFQKAVPPAPQISSENISSRPARPTCDEVTINEHRYVEKPTAKTSQPQQHLISQFTTLERILRPDGSKANKVILTNRLPNGKEEKTEIVQDAAKVLDEVEKAMWLMDGRKVCW